MPGTVLTYRVSAAIPMVGPVDAVVVVCSYVVAILLDYSCFFCKIKIKTRGQRPNESQKAVIIYMMKSVGEIASKMWPVV